MSGETYSCACESYIVLVKPGRPNRFAMDKASRAEVGFEAGKSYL